MSRQIWYSNHLIAFLNESSNANSTAGTIVSFRLYYCVTVRSTMLICAICAPRWQFAKKLFKMWRCVYQSYLIFIIVVFLFRLRSIFAQCSEDWSVCIVLFTLIIWLNSIYYLQWKSTLVVVVVVGYFTISNGMISDWYTTESNANGAWTPIYAFIAKAAIEYIRCAHWDFH